MIGGLVVILLCQLLGELVVKTTHIPIPGAVVGMVLFFAVLIARKPNESSGLVRGGDLLLRFLPLFFVPATVGIIAYLPVLAAQWLPVTVGLVGSWFLALAVTGALATAFFRLRARRQGGKS